MISIQVTQVNLLGVPEVVLRDKNCRQNDQQNGIAAASSPLQYAETVHMYMYMYTDRAWLWAVSCTNACCIIHAELSKK